MDPVTQGLLGATAAQAVATRRLHHKAVWVGAAAGMAADLDIFIHIANNPLSGILYHRGFTHALLFIPIGGFIIASLFISILKSYRLHWRWVILAAIIAYGTHGILDSFTSYGTVLFWPFSDYRAAWDFISIIDPIFTIILLLGMVASLYFDKAYPAIIALLVCAMYLSLGAWQHHRALQFQKDIANKQHHVWQRGRVMPRLASLQHWNSIYMSENKLYSASLDVPFFGKDHYHQRLVIPLFKSHQLPSSVQKNKHLMYLYHIFTWFSDGYVARVKRTPFTLIDMRYVFGSNPVLALWGIAFERNKQQHYQLKRVRRLKIYQNNDQAS